MMGLVSNSLESAAGKLLHGLFNHVSTKKTWRTTGVTSGYTKLKTPCQEYFYTKCDTANARSKGLRNKQIAMIMAGCCNVGTTKTEDSKKVDYEIDPVRPSKEDNHWEAVVRGRSSESMPTHVTFQRGRA